MRVSLNKRPSYSTLLLLIFTLLATSSYGQTVAGSKADQAKAASSQPLAAAFRSGKLPEPLEVSASGDALASTLAKKVAAKDNGSLPALVAAVLSSGIGIRDAKGNVVQSVKPGQGLAIDDWEIAAAAKMYGDGRNVPLSYFSGGLASIPELKRLPLEKILLDGIRAHAGSDQPVMRFWARFIVEMSKARGQALLTADPRTIELDAVQVSLILRRLIGDHYALSRPQNASAARRFQGFEFLYASAAGPSTMIDRGSSALRNCGSALGEGDAAVILDVAATVITSGWGALLEQDGLGRGAERYNRFLAVANILLAYAKFIATYAALETEIKVDDEPLVRTRNAQPGERRQLTATVAMDTGGWENINCFRTALNVATGLDLSLIKDGPIEGVEVNWHLDQGLDYYSNSTGITGNRPIVGFAGENAPRIQDAGTYTGIPGRSGTPVGNLTRTKTDRNGNAKIFLEGAPKIPYVADPVRTVMKDVRVRTTIKMKGGDIKGDAADVAGQALGVILGGAAGLLTMPLELLYRTDWASSGSLVVDVKDHERCNGEWVGTVTYSESYKDERSFQDRNQTTSQSAAETFDAVLEIAGEQENRNQRVLVYPAALRASASRDQRRFGRGTTTALCNLENLATTNGSGRYEGTGKVNISLMPDDTYSVTFHLPSIAFTAQRETSRKVLECKNPFIKGSSSSSTVEVRMTAAGIDIEGSLDPKAPHIIKGSKTVDIPERFGKRTATVKWDLVRCGR